jgi:gas vesicle protein
MKKFTFLVGMATGFIVGSRAGRGPYEQLERSVRQAINHPKVQKTLHSAADGAESIRNAALDATTGAIDDASDVATTAIDETSKRIRNGTQGVASKVRNSA